MDLQEAFDAGFVAVKRYVDGIESTVNTRLAAMEKAIADFPVPSNGKDGAPGEKGADGEDGAAGRDGSDGRDGTDGQNGQNGKDGIDGKDGAAGQDGAAGRDGVDGAPGQDGKDGANATDEQVAAAVKAYLETNPPAAGKDGRDGTDGKDGAIGEKGDAGRDGVGLSGALIDRDGNLVLTLTNGEHKSLGAVIGKDGTNGTNGEPGAPGTNGNDGLGFDDMDLVDTGAGLALRFARGDVTKDFALPVVIDRGVWREGDYTKGAGVTWGGSFWIAQRDTSDKPETSDAWRLAVKKGRDGKSV